jgi:hypothetical protein
MPRRFYVAAMVAASLTAPFAEASTLELTPALNVSEEYNDNIYGTADGRKTDFITRVQPGAKLRAQSPLMNLDASYIFDYRNYAKGHHGDEKIHNADLKATLQLLENLFFVDLGDALHRTTVDVARDVATESLLATQTNQNIASVSPYLLWRPSSKGTLRSGYRYTDTRYFEGEGIDKREHVGFLSFQQQVSDKLVLNAGYAFTSAAASAAYDRRLAGYPFAGAEATSGDFERHDLSGGFRYNFKPASSIFGSLGNSWNRFSGGIYTRDLFWDAGVSHDFNLAVALLETRVQNVEDPLSSSTRQVSYTARIDRTFSRGGMAAGATYLENFVTRTGRFESRRGTVTGSGRYEITPRVTTFGSVYAERFSRTLPDSYPYRFTANGGVSYGFFNNDTMVTVSYTLVCDRLDWDSSRREKLTDRVLFAVRTLF